MSLSVSEELPGDEVDCAGREEKKPSVTATGKARREMFIQLLGWGIGDNSAQFMRRERIGFYVCYLHRTPVITATRRTFYQ